MWSMELLRTIPKSKHKVKKRGRGRRGEGMKLKLTVTHIRRTIHQSAAIIIQYLP
jgi:hypothetical protein